MALPNSLKFPNPYNPNDCILVGIPISIVPIIMGNLSLLEDRHAWASDSDWELGYHAVVEIEAMMICTGGIVEALNTIATKLDCLCQQQQPNCTCEERIAKAIESSEKVLRDIARAISTQNQTPQIVRSEIAFNCTTNNYEYIDPTTGEITPTPPPEKWLYPPKYPYTDPISDEIGQKVPQEPPAFDETDDPDMGGDNGTGKYSDVEVGDPSADGRCMVARATITELYNYLSWIDFVVDKGSEVVIELTDVIAAMTMYGAATNTTQPKGLSLKKAPDNFKKATINTAWVLMLLRAIKWLFDVLGISMLNGFDGAKETLLCVVKTSKSPSDLKTRWDNAVNAHYNMTAPQRFYIKYFMTPELAEIVADSGCVVRDDYEYLPDLSECAGCSGFIVGGTQTYTNRAYADPQVRSITVIDWAATPAAYLDWFDEDSCPLASEALVRPWGFETERAYLMPPNGMTIKVLDIEEGKTVVIQGMEFGSPLFELGLGASGTYGGRHWIVYCGGDSPFTIDVTFN